MSTTISIQGLVTELQTVVNAHNDSPLTPPEQHVRWETVQAKLVGGGFTSVDTIREVKHEDLAPEVPIGIARALVTKIRTLLNSSRPVGPTGVSTFRAPQMANSDLIAKLDPNDGTGIVRRELAKRLRDAGQRADAPYIVLNPDGTVNPEPTLQAFEELLQGEEPRKTMRVGGTEHIVYPVNEARNIRATVHPLIDGAYLRADGTHGPINWGVLPEDVRQFLYVGSREKLDGLHRLDPKGIAGVFTEARSGGLETLQISYPETWERFFELKEDDNLPKQVTRRRPKSRNRSGVGSEMNLAGGRTTRK